MMEDKMIKAIAIVTTRKLHLYNSILKEYQDKKIPSSRLDKLNQSIVDLDYSLFLTDREKNEKTIFTQTDLREILEQNPEIQNTLRENGWIIHN